MTKSIPLLRNLRIGSCEMLSRIVAEENGMGESSVDEVEFPQLKSLALSGVPNLVSFFPNVNTTWAKSSDYYHNSVQPQPLFNEKVAIPCLEYLQLSGLENVRNVFNPSMAGGLVNLQDLLIDDCLTLEVVVGKEEEVGGHGRKIDKTLFPQLIQLQLGSLPKLKRFCHFTQPLEIPLLRAMGIADCPSMDAFSLGDVSVPNLSLPGISWNGDLNNAIQSWQKMSVIATEGAPHSQQQVPPTPFMSQKPFPWKQKIVIKVAMVTQKSRAKALKIAVGVSGVESATLAGQDKNQIQVIGDRIDVVALVNLLRKNVGYSELVSVGPVPMKKMSAIATEGAPHSHQQVPPTPFMSQMPSGMKKVVLRVDYRDNKGKEKAMKTVSGLDGVESIVMDAKDKKLTVIGDIDPVRVCAKLRELCYTEIITVGPAKELEKKEEPKKPDEKKKDEPAKPNPVAYPYTNDYQYHLPGVADDFGPR